MQRKRTKIASWHLILWQYLEVIGTEQLMTDEFQVGSLTEHWLRIGQLYWAAFPDLISDNTHVIVSTNVKVHQMLENKKKKHIYKKLSRSSVPETRWNPMHIVAQLHAVF